MRKIPHLYKYWNPEKNTWN